MKIYTRTGDKGETSLFGGNRIAKDDPRIEAYGTVDELNSLIGMARAGWPSSPIDAELNRVQSDLFEIGAYLAAPGSERFHSVNVRRIEDLEKAIDSMEAKLQPLTTFIVPGGSMAAAQLHLTRTVCRRAERRIVALGDATAEAQTTIAYLNRLSDYLFVAARLANLRHGIADTPWTRR